MRVARSGTARATSSVGVTAALVLSLLVHAVLLFWPWPQQEDSGVTAQHGAALQEYRLLPGEPEVPAASTHRVDVASMVTAEQSEWTLRWPPAEPPLDTFEFEPELDEPSAPEPTEEIHSDTETPGPDAVSDESEALSDESEAVSDESGAVSDESKAVSDDTATMPTEYLQRHQDLPPVVLPDPIWRDHVLAVPLPEYQPVEQWHPDQASLSHLPSDLAINDPPPPLPGEVGVPVSAPPIDSTAADQQVEASALVDQTVSPGDLSGGGGTDRESWQSRVSAALNQALLRQPPDYPRISQRRREEGTVWVAFEVMTTGQVQEVRLAESSGHARLDDAALLRINRITDLPALWEHLPGSPGHEVAMPLHFEVPIHFQLQ